MQCSRANLSIDFTKYRSDTVAYFNIKLAI